MSRIIPAILTRDEQSFRKCVATVAPFAPLIQIDVLDGTMLPEKSFADTAKIGAMHLTIPFEAHLMVNDPEVAAREWLHIGAQRVVIHVEAHGNLGLALERIRHDNRVAGIAINPDTDLDALKEFIPFAHYILVMGVHPGGQGHTFNPATIDRVSALHHAYPKHIIGVDGGATAKKHIVHQLAVAGADDIIAGSVLAHSDNPAATYAELVRDATLR